MQAMDGWKHGKPFALLVCPVYQLPSRTSQIYQQAATRSVCICSYTNLAVLVRYAEVAGPSEAIGLLHNVFKTVEAMNPFQKCIGILAGSKSIISLYGSHHC